MILPKPNNSEILWSEEDSGVLSRMRLECHLTHSPHPTYTLHAEICQSYEREDGVQIEYWEEGAVVLDAFRRSLHKLLLGFRSVADPTVTAFLRMLAKGKTEFPTKKPVKVARASGWSVTVSPGGSLCDGSPLFALEFSRSLGPEEMLAFLGKVAEALDHYDGTH